MILQRIPKLQAEDQAIWWDTLNKMQKLFRKSAHSLHTQGKIDDETMHNYFMSGNYPPILFINIIFATISDIKSIHF